MEILQVKPSAKKAPKDLLRKLRHNQPRAFGVHEQERMMKRAVFSEVVLLSGENSEETKKS
ncbi:hypothetical protein L484_013066 [Morus notabilis]|uniref:Uncharacterized protein n=1 Tax=Morus notabilis TaxID=981085 RepID=W9RM85_9ROSA|nr:hypothetical protein L484_013066 [Morus notabilis]